MHTIEVTIPLSVLKAMRLLAAKDDVRPYMNGVALSRGYIAAGDGRHMSVYRCESLDGAPEVIIPTGVIDVYAKKARGYHTDDVTVRWEEADEGDEDRQRYGWLTNTVEEERFALIGYVYPPFERVLAHHTKPVGNPQFNWTCLALFEKVAKALGVKSDYKIFVIPNGNNPARLLMLDHPDFEGVLGVLDWKTYAPVKDAPAEDPAADLV